MRWATALHQSVRRHGPGRLECSHRARGRNPLALWLRSRIYY
jgi:hypothetical protein